MNASFINGYDITTFTVDENNNILSTLMSSSIEGYEIFNTINHWKREDTMLEKYWAKEKIKNEFYGGNISNGAHVNGDSRSLSPRMNLSEFSGDGREYSYTEGDNYYSEVARMTNEMPQTQSENHSLNRHNVNNYTDLYSEHTNLYPDDKDGLEGKDKGIVWENTDNRNSLLSKTKELFRQNKINTIISRFHTDSVGDEQDVGSAFGLSHGRNLLKRNQEYGQAEESPNGNDYGNPYCRVWTHHYQYDNLAKLIRPFVTDRDGENPVGVKLEDLHTWTSDFLQESDLSGTGWKNHNERWNQSVLNENGHINITPKFRDGGAGSLHTKQCMFSIENLAWKGMSPYEFERNVSWEQRGPMGGRIMWFPPYGISFQETTSAQWNTSSFIGRGEDVYTYVNTKRSGSLNFMMVVDHPSVTDYTTWYRKPGDKGSSNLPTDTDYLRFFAGCDSGQSTDNGGASAEGGTTAYSLFSATRPPEYTEHESQNPNKNVPVSDPNPSPEMKDIVEDEAPEEKPINIIFYVFYPNNYTGVYDLPNSTASKDSKVNFAAYLINGMGTNKHYIKEKKNDKNDNSVFPWKYTSPTEITSSLRDEIVNYTADEPIDESTYAKLIRGNGYEIYQGESGIGYVTDGNVYDKYVPIIGTTTVWSGITCSKGKPYPMMDGKTLNKRGEYPVYYYRPDGEYVTPSSKSDPAIYLNTYDDQLKVGNYQDKKSFGYNSSIGYEDVASHFNENTDPDGEDCLYAFTEVAAALEYTKYGKSFENAGIVDSSRLAKLVDLVNNYDVVEVRGYGSASSHSNSAASDVNQDNLNLNRYKSVVSWLKSKKNSPFVSNKINWGEGVDANNKVTAVDDGEQNVSTSSAKLGRYAKIVVTVKAGDRKKLSETSQSVRTLIPLTENVQTLNDVTNVVSVASTDAEGNKTYTLNQVNEEKESVQKSVDYGITEAGEVEIAKIMSKYNKTREEAISILFGDIYNESNIDGDGGFIGGILNESVITATRSNKKLDNKVEKTVVSETNENDRKNYLRYDQEYRFFKELQLTDPVVFNNLIDKLQYFDPAFHSMTPEGFNGRLAFLHQCTRQGNTISSSDQNGQATNLSFGRPPICVLRLGDFYNQMIVINSISMTYDTDGGVQWDLNPEGSGVQPLIAHITLNFDFIGGGDMTGPIRRLQNAMTFNYYANQSLYDNRADWVQRKWNNTTADSFDKEHYDGVLNEYHYLGPVQDDRVRNNLSGDETTNNEKHD